MNRLYCLILFLILQPVFPCAASPINVDGLTIECADCSQVDPGYCEIPTQGRRATVLCSEMLDYLLPELASKNEKVSYPTAPELSGYLLRGRHQEKTVQAAFRLLVRSEEGRVLAVNRRKELTQHYPGLFLNFVQSNQEGAALASLLHRELRYPRGEAELALAAVSLLRSSDAEKEKLYEYLTAAELSEDESKLTVFSQTIEKLDPGFANELGNASFAVAACRSAATVDSILASCNTVDYERFSAAGASYLRQVVVNRILQAVANEGPHPLDSLKLIEKTPYEKIRTPAMHQLVASALKQLVDQGSQEELLELLSPKLFGMLALFAKNDETVRSELKRLRAARGSSFDDEPRQRLNELLGGEEPPARSVSWIRVAAIASVFFLMIAGVVFLILKNRKKKEKGSEALNSTERAELRSLRAYFELSPASSLQQLAHTYRLRARLLHPDSAKGNVEAFRELNEKYLRAKALIQKC